MIFLKKKKKKRVNFFFRCITLLSEILEPRIPISIVKVNNECFL